jgi:hypothetical protein
MTIITQFIFGVFATELFTLLLARGFAEAFW